MHEKYKKEVEAYADNEMNEEQTKRYEETLNAFPVLQDYLQKLENQKALLKKWWSTQKHN